MSDGGDDRVTSGSAHGRCPICRKPGTEKYRPFCSKRCADIDLGRWLSGTYVVAGGTEDADEDGEARSIPPGEPTDGHA